MLLNPEHAVPSISRLTEVQNDMAEAIKGAASMRIGAEEKKCLSPSSYPECISYQNPATGGKK